MQVREQRALLLGQRLVHRHEHEGAADVLRRAQCFDLLAQVRHMTVVAVITLDDMRQVSVQVLNLAMSLDSLREFALEQSVESCHLRRRQAQVTLYFDRAPPPAL